jgi:protoheme ferro-lyase
MGDFDSIVLVAFGGPKKPADISPFPVGFVCGHIEMLSRFHRDAHRSCTIASQGGLT